MHQPKNPLLRALFRANADERKKTSGSPATYSRRDFLVTGSKAAAFIGLSSMLPEFLFSGGLKPKVVIVGAGIAGLNAAHYLKMRGIHADIYEASTRTGGRIFSKSNGVVNGCSCEIGAEFIDTSHTEMRSLARKFGLQLKNANNDPLHRGYEHIFFIGGKKYSSAQVLAEYSHYQKRISRDYAILDNIKNPRYEKLDNQSISAYLDDLQMNGWFRTLMETAYESEFGMRPDEQSSWNFISMIGVNDKGFEMYGESDDVFGVRGGNAMITQKLHEYVSSQIQLDHTLTAIRSRNRKYSLSFANGKEVNADFVIMTLPFTMLRNVDMQIEDMSREKRNAIENLGYGNNSKLILGFNKRPWRMAHTAGYLFNEDIENGWDSSYMQNNNRGVGSFTVYTGAAKAVRMANAKDRRNELSREYLPILEKVFPGAESSFNGNSIVADWPNQPFIKGSYAAWKTGQWTSIKGREIEPVGNIFFAGEHCSEDYQGFMEGGARTGKIAANGVLRQLKMQAFPEFASRHPQVQEFLV